TCSSLKSMTFKEGKLTDQELWLLAKHILKFWKRVGRALKLEEYILDEIDIDVSDVYEQSLAMLRRWSEHQGSRATYKVLGEALLDPTVDRDDLVKKFCSDGTEADAMLPQSIPPVTILLGEPFHKTYQRNKELRTLHDLYTTLDPDNTCSDVTMVYLTGPPGAGKSQLSRLYAQWYGQRDCANKSCSKVVATLHAETPESLLESYRRLTCALGITLTDVAKGDDVKKKLKVYSSATKKLFQKCRYFNFEWLIVVDNVFASDPLKEFWPLPGNGWGKGRVIVSTQDSELAPSAHTHSRTLSLSQGMAEDDAIDFLCLISELEKDDACAVVAKELNYYPLSLACAAVFVRDMRNDRPAAKFSWKDYLANLHKYFEHLKYSEFTDHNICYPRSMLSAAFCSASRMAEGSDILRGAFKFLSRCTLQPVPLELVADAVLATAREEVLIPDEVKKTLARCSLLTYPRNGARGVEVVTMHQVMRAAFVQLRKESCKVAIETAGPGMTVKMLDEKNFMEMLDTLCNYYLRFRNIDEHAISTRILLSPHLQGYIDTANNMNLTNNEEFIDGSVCLADSLIHVAGGTDYHRVQLLEAARKIQTKLQLKNLCACRLLSDLGYTYREAGKLDKVVPVLEEANIIAEKHDGIEWMKQRSHILNVLAFTYRESYQLDLASTYMLTCVDVTKQVYGNEHAEVIERLCNYAIILNDCGSNDEAIEIMEEAHRMTEALGIDSQTAVFAQMSKSIVINRYDYQPLKQTIADLEQQTSHQSQHENNDPLEENHLFSAQQELGPSKSQET
ncbi:hypothetical protein QZH41_013352, partial [Actinostola sp. cb2023]